MKNMEDNTTCHKRYTFANRREKREMDNRQKHWDKERETQQNALNRETREIAVQLRKLLAEQNESKESLRLVGRLLHQMDADEALRGQGTRAEQRKLGNKYNKSLDKLIQNSKLHPKATIDPSTSSPPNAHDVAVRMLANKHAPKRKQARQPPPGMAARPVWSENISTSKTVRGDSEFKLPRITSVQRHSLTSMDPPNKPSVSPRVQIRQRSSSISGTIPQPGEDSSTHQKQGSLRKSSMRLVKAVSSSHKQEDGDTEQLDVEALEHYYNLLVEGEQHLRESDASFTSINDAYGPSASLKRNERRKLLAMEALLKQLPSLKKKEEAQIRPEEALNCRYLRLTQSNIKDLEEACLVEGTDPGLHAHMDPEQCLSYYDKLREKKKEAEASMEIEWVNTESSEDN